MKRHFGIISVIAFISFFMLFSNSCGGGASSESSERLDEAQKYYDEAVSMFRHDSLSQALYKFIDVLALVENLPEDMTEREKHLASRSYNNITRILSSKLAVNEMNDAARKSYYYQNISNEIDTLVYPMICLAMAAVYDSEMESSNPDSVIYYSKMAIPLIDTLGEDASIYVYAQFMLSKGYYRQKKYDSCFYIKRNMIAFSDRRGLDVKADSMALGVDMFHSPYRHLAKPYLLKVLEIDANNVVVGLVMNLLEQIYEEENNADSVAFCRGYYKPYIEAEKDRVENHDRFIEIYDGYSISRDVKLANLREQNEQRKRISIILIVLVASVSVLIFIFRKNKMKFSKQNEYYNNIIADSEFKHSLVDGKIKKMNQELRKKEEIIKAKEMELDEMKQKIERIENSPNIPNIESYYKSDICRKIVNRKATDFSALTNEDFALLIQAADKHLNNITTRLKEKYPKINKEDLYYICLILLNTDENKMQYLINKNRKTIWYRLSKIRNMFELENNDDILIYIIENFIN